MKKEPNSPYKLEVNSLLNPKWECQVCLVVVVVVVCLEVEILPS
jgi:hypothetical protein